MKSRTNKGARQALGSGLVEGVVGAGLVIAVVCGGVMLLVNSGMATYYKLKIGDAACETAKYVNTLDKHERMSKAKAYARTLLKTLDIQDKDFQLELKDTKLNGVDATVCMIKCNNLSMIGSWLGPADIREVGVAPYNEFLVNKTVEIEFNKNHYHIPVYEEGGKDSVGKLATKGYMAVSTVNHSGEPRRLVWVLPAEYKSEGYRGLPGDQRIFRPQDRHDLRQTFTNRNDFPSHGYNGVYYVEVGSGIKITK